MWAWLIAGAVLLWFFRGGQIGVGQATVPQLPGAAGVVQTVGLMRAMANSAINHPLIRRYAVQATEGVPRGHRKEAALAIQEWVRRHMRYVPDPFRHERLTNPALLAEALSQGRTIYGDCDDMSMLMAAMAKSIGLNPQFHAVGRADKFHHVYVKVDGVTLDPTVGFGAHPFRTGRGLASTV